MRIDRLIHRAEVVEIEAGSYRLKEAKELNAARTKRRGKNTDAPFIRVLHRRARVLHRMRPLFTGELH